ncbi:MAG: C39 family peptidase [Massiliimalia sp.]|jgi:hypothetical protein
MEKREYDALKRQLKRKKKRKRKLRWFRIAVFALFLCTVSALVFLPDSPIPNGANLPSSSQPQIRTEELEAYAQEQGYSLDDYPQELIELYDKNPDTRDFVFQYPEKKDKDFSIDLSSCVGTESVPLLMQWDQRWGYDEYAGELFALSGCGPTCLSMVTLFLTDDPSMTPKAMGEFARENGYATDQNGTSWTLFSEGAQKLGLQSRELPLDHQQIISNLEEGNPIVCIMGPGDFTTTGHYIVMTGYQDGKILVNDPNSYRNSEQGWDLEQISDQIRNLWVFT